MILYFSRLREYYADAFSVQLAPTRREGARRLSEALAKIVYRTAGSRHWLEHSAVVGSFKALLIADPDSAERDAEALGARDQELVRRLLRRRVTLADTILELFSTHPNIVKRLRALQELAR